MAMSAEWDENMAYCRQCGEYLRVVATAAISRPGLQLHLHQTLGTASNDHGVYFHVAKSRLAKETVGKSALRHKPVGGAFTVIPGGWDLREYMPWRGDGAWVKCTNCGRINHVLLRIDPPRYILPEKV